MKSVIEKVKDIFAKPKKKFKMLGIVAEFNPLHEGHKTLLNFAKQISNNICVALSPNMVQRGEFACFENIKRALASINEGADIVIEIPHIFALSSAKYYADGAIRILKESGCDAILFGSEIENKETFERLYEKLQYKETKEKIYSEMKKGLSYKNSCISVFNEIDPYLAKIFDLPNSTLAIEYIDACKKYNLDYQIIKRTGSYHSQELNDKISSASAIRKAISQNYDFSLLPISKTFKKNNFTYCQDAYFYSLKYQICQTEIKNIYDVREGIENLIKENISSSISMNDFLEITCNKRYSKSKILRICSHIFFDIKEDIANYLKENIEYIRVLAIKKEAVKLLSNSSLFITKYKDLIDKNLINKNQFLLQKKVDCAFYSFSNRSVEYKNMIIVL